MARSSSPLPVEGVPDFWQRVRSAEHLFLGLDYDGTLAPFQLDRFKAYPLPGVIDVLRQIRQQKNTTLVVVSGRPVKEILQFIDNLGIMIIGSHGTELYSPDNALQVVSLTFEQSEAFAQAVGAANQIGLPERLEEKATSVAFHTRGLSEDEKSRFGAEVGGAWREIASRFDLVCHQFNGGIELRLADVDKGTALRKILSQLSDKTFAVYIGDDLTDEDAFREIKALGIGIKVTKTEVSTRAEGRLSDCEAVLNFLRQWSEFIQEMEARD